MKRILIIFIGHENTEFISQQRAYREAFSSNEIAIETTSIKEGPETIEQDIDEILAAPGILKEVENAERDGVDAVIVDCALDPLLSALREYVRIPVIGAGHSAYLTAAVVGEKFSIISPLTSLIPAYERRIRQYGLISKLCSIRCINTPIEDLLHEDAVTAFIDAGKRAVDLDGADVLVLGCTGMSPVVPILQDALPVPIIDPAAAAITTAESIIRLAITHSVIAYPYKKRDKEFQQCDH